MKSKMLIRVAGIVGLVVVVATVLWVLKDKRSASAPVASVPVPAVQPAESSPVVPEVAQPVAPQKSQMEVIPAEAPRRENVVPEMGGAVEKVVRVKPSQRLATVNGVTLTLKDLLPLPKEKAGAEQMMSAEMFDFLFTRAVERELTVQAARAEGVELTPQQKERLAEIRAQSEQKDPNVFDTVGQNPENVEFEQRDFAGLMLQAMLAEKSGVPSPHVTSEMVEAYFQEHKNEYSQVPADPAQRSPEAWQTVDAEIRMKLAPGVQSAHDEQMKKFVEAMKGKASIVLTQKE